MKSSGHRKETEPAPNPYSARCATRLVLDRIGDKWAVLVLGLLAEEPTRFNQLRRAIEGVSQKVLSQTLKSLERDGLVRRRAFATVPVTVEYSITPAGAVAGRDGERAPNSGRKRTSVRSRRRKAVTTGPNNDS